MRLPVCACDAFSKTMRLVDLLVEIVHRPVEQAQRFAALARVFGQQGMFRMLVLEMVDDRPETGHGRSVEIEQDRQMRQRDLPPPPDRRRSASRPA